MTDHMGWLDELDALEQRCIEDLKTLMAKDDARFMHPNARMVIRLVAMLDDIYEHFEDAVAIQVARLTADENPMTFAELLEKLDMTEEELEGENES